LGHHHAVSGWLRFAKALRNDEQRLPSNASQRGVRAWVASRLAIWLWTLLLRGKPGRSYNVGSEVEVSIAEAAHAVSESFDPAPPVEIARTPVPGQLPERYVPSTERATNELGLRTQIDFRDAVRKTARWMRAATLN
jgi:nucleoside-diphosphate-sugar epimerase